MGMMHVMDVVQSNVRVVISSSLAGRIEVAIMHEPGFIAFDGRPLIRLDFDRN